MSEQPPSGQDRLASLRSSLREVFRGHPRVRHGGEMAPLFLGAGDDDDEDVERARSLVRELAAIGWSVPSWPIEFGGHAPEEIAVYRDEYRRCDPVDLYPFGPAIHVVGPALIEWANPQQRHRLIPPIVAGDAIWCLLFSEPDAGSDLAAVRTAALKTNDGWLIDGVKLWTSRAAYADKGLLLARTGAGDDRYSNLTMFALDMRQPGVTARRITQMNGDRHFCQVEFTDALVTDDDVIGDVNHGWVIARDVLKRERVGDPAAAALSPRAVVRELIRLAQSQGANESGPVRDSLARLYADARVLGLVARSEVGRTGSAGSGSKLRLSAFVKSASDLALQLLGPVGTGFERDQGWLTFFLTSPSLSIRGGTDEIQRNLVAEQVLGLPREVRVESPRGAGKALPRG